jgi:hypothetical protein
MQYEQIILKQCFEYKGGGFLRAFFSVWAAMRGISNSDTNKKTAI